MDESQTVEIKRKRGMTVAIPPCQCGAKATVSKRRYDGSRLVLELDYAHKADLLGGKCEFDT